MSFINHFVVNLQFWLCNVRRRWWLCCWGHSAVKSFHLLRVYNSKDTWIHCWWSFVFNADYWTIFHMINEQVVLIVRCFYNISFRSHKNHSTIAISTPIVRQISTNNLSQGVSNQAIETIEPYLVQSVLLAQSEHFIPPSKIHTINSFAWNKKINNTISQWFMNLPNWQSIAVIKMLATMVAHSITRETANACARAV